MVIRETKSQCSEQKKRKFSEERKRSNKETWEKGGGARYGMETILICKIVRSKYLLDGGQLLREP